MSSKSKIPLILVFGPTAVGKSEFIYSLFSNGYEVINSDSQQVYKYLDIGTAKPGKDELARLPHHLISIIDPKEQFNAGQFVLETERLSSEIFARGHIPVISGGTPFYLRNLIHGLPEVPPSDIHTRARLNERLKRQGIAPLYNELSVIDPFYAKKIGDKNTVRILRALEIFELTGKSISSFEIPRIKNDCFSFFLAGLTLERKELYRRINNRVDAMFEKGLVKEVKNLFARGYSETDPGMKGIGYKEFFLMNRTCMTFQDVKELIKLNTRHFAKRQITFFKSFDSVKWYRPDQKEAFTVDLADFLKYNIGKDFNVKQILSGSV